MIHHDRRRDAPNSNVSSPIRFRTSQPSSKKRITRDCRREHQVEQSDCVKTMWTEPEKMMSEAECGTNRGNNASSLERGPDGDSLSRPVPVIHLRFISKDHLVRRPNHYQTVKTDAGSAPILTTPVPDWQLI